MQDVGDVEVSIPVEIKVFPEGCWCMLEVWAAEEEMVRFWGGCNGQRQLWDGYVSMGGWVR